MNSFESSVHSTSWYFCNGPRLCKQGFFMLTSWSLIQANVCFLVPSISDHTSPCPPIAFLQLTVFDAFLHASRHVESRRGEQTINKARVCNIFTAMELSLPKWDFFTHSASQIFHTVTPPSSFDTVVRLTTNSSWFYRIQAVDVQHCEYQVRVLHDASAFAAFANSESDWSKNSHRTKLMDTVPQYL